MHSPPVNNPLQVSLFSFRSTSPTTPSVCTRITHRPSNSIGPSLNLLFPLQRPPSLLYSPNLLHLDWIHFQDDSPTWLTGWGWLSARCLPRAFDQGASVPLYLGFFTVQCGSWVPTVFQETGSGICRSLKAWA